MIWYIIGVAGVFVWSTFLTLWLGRRVQTAFDEHRAKYHNDKDKEDPADDSSHICFKCGHEVSPERESFYITKGGRVTCHACVVKGYRELRRRHKELKYSAHYLVDIMKNWHWERMTYSSVSQKENDIICSHIRSAQEVVEREFRRSNHE